MTKVPGGGWNGSARSLPVYDRHGDAVYGSNLLKASASASEDINNAWVHGKPSPESGMMGVARIRDDLAAGNTGWVKCV